MLMSTGQAAALLAEAGVARTQAQILLAAGLAGRGVRCAGAVLYDDGAVTALAARPQATREGLVAACPHGLVIARLDRARKVDVTIGWKPLAAQLSGQPPMPPLTRALLAARMAAYGSLPWVATLCGRVVLGADAVRVELGADGNTRFTLAPPGEWFAVLIDRALATGRGGRSWMVRTPR